MEQALAMSALNGCGSATALANLGELFLLLGQTAAAEQHFQESLQLAGSPFVTIEVLGNLGLLRQLQGQLPQPPAFSPGFGSRRRNPQRFVPGAQSLPPGHPGLAAG
ncbi:MAG: hypothetical protein IPO15_20895 [Anaerolineae bacterium]|nr:hypothetical protein [Anaerolineae bacterium]